MAVSHVSFDVGKSLPRGQTNRFLLPPEVTARSRRKALSSKPTNAGPPKPALSLSKGWRS